MLCLKKIKILGCLLLTSTLISACGNSSKEKEASVDNSEVVNKKNDTEAINIFVQTITGEDQTQFKKINKNHLSYESFLQNVGKEQGKIADKTRKSNELYNYVSADGTTYNQKDLMELEFNTIGKHLLPEADFQESVKQGVVTSKTVEYKLKLNTFNWREYNKMIDQANSIIPDNQLKDYTELKETDIAKFVENQSEYLEYKKPHNSYYLAASFSSETDNIGSNFSLFDKNETSTVTVNFTRNSKGKLEVGEQAFADFIYRIMGDSSDVFLESY